MNPKSRLEVVADITGNTITMSFLGTLDGQEMARHHEKIVSAVRSLQPGFALLVDFTDLDAMSVDCVPVIEGTMDLMKNKNVGLVVRVIPDPTKDIGVGIMSLFHYPRTLKIITTETREEAKAVLAQAR